MSLNQKYMKHYCPKSPHMIISEEKLPFCLLLYIYIFVLIPHLSLLTSGRSIPKARARDVSIHVVI